VRSAVVLAVVLVAGCVPGDGPQLDAVTPTEGAPGDEVVLTGSGLCGAGDCDPLPTGMVSFGIDPQIDGIVTSWADDEIGARVPQSVAAGDILIVVTVDGRSSNGVSFRVTP
jgi:hypothetical protein